MKIDKDNIVNITDFARNTSKYEKKIKNGPIAVVKNGKTLFIAAKPKTDYSSMQKIMDLNKDLNKSDYLTNLAKRNIKENIYYLMRFESPNITFPEIESIIDKDTQLTKKLKFEKVVTEDLMNGWQEIIYSNKKLNLNFIINLNATVAGHQALEVGKLRDKKVFISGTDYEPKIPSVNMVNNKIKEVLNLDPVDGAVEYLAWGIKSQLFFDGNKRTSILIANKILKDAGIGLLSIKVKDMHQFNVLLNKYYNDEKTKEILKTFIVKNCIYNNAEGTFIKM